MPEFKYKAKEGPSRIVEGVVDAANVDLAIGKVINLGLTPIDVSLNIRADKLSSKPIGKDATRLAKHISRKDLVLFARQMSDLIGAAVPILKSLQLVMNQTSNVYFKEVVRNMLKAVEDGSAFSDALSQEDDVFPPVYINMVRTGELSGKLDFVLSRLADHLEKEMDTNNKVKSSLAYPFLILIVGAATIFILLSFVIPRITVMFDDLDQALPLPTVILVNIGNVFANFWWLFILIVLAAVFYAKQFIHSEKGRLWFDTLKLRLPLLGNFEKINQVGRFARAMATMVDSGVPITTALNSVWPALDNVVLKSEIKRIAEEVTKGGSFRDSLNQSAFFPDMAINMLSIGEETGKLEQGLYKIAETYERQSEEITKTMISLLGPIVLVLVVSIVGAVVIAMLLPIFKMNLLIQ